MMYRPANARVQFILAPLLLAQTLAFRRGQLHSHHRHFEWRRLLHTDCTIAALICVAIRSDIGVGLSKQLLHCRDILNSEVSL